jgi:hypothetical protein
MNSKDTAGDGVGYSGGCGESMYRSVSSEAVTSSTTDLRRSSNSPRYLRK